MTRRIGRRAFVRGAAALTAAPLLARPRMAAANELHMGDAAPFSFERLVDEARRRAARAYVPPPEPDPEIVPRINYDAYGQIKFRPEFALYADGPGVYPITFKMVGEFFRKSVRMYAVADGRAREILYSPDYFEMPEDHIARKLGETPSAFAGFWVEESKLAGDWTEHEPWATFLGASYWRAKGELGQVGMSSRGISIGTGDPEPEQFPDFIAHYFEPALRPEDPVVVHSLLDGPSVAGAFRFHLYRTTGVVIEVENRLFFREKVPHLGIAPLTSMFWYAEYNKRFHEDWRPEVHDSDGLAIWTGAGERIWRPLENPPRIVTSSFLDENPKGFGLMQRDRDFEHYLDGVRYERRPSTWIEPLGGWGKGAVRLIETPTNDEIYDNVNAFWHPEQAVGDGTELAFAYRQHWLERQPYPPEHLAFVVATRIGRGGEPGRPRPPGLMKIVVEFEGGDLAKLPEDAEVEPVVSAPRAELGRMFAERVPGTERWRAVFDLQETDANPVDLRLYLRSGDLTLSETWMYQLQPELGS